MTMMKKQRNLLESMKLPINLLNADVHTANKPYACLLMS